MPLILYYSPRAGGGIQVRCIGMGLDNTDIDYTIILVGNDSVLVAPRSTRLFDMSPYLCVWTCLLSRAGGVAMRVKDHMIVECNRSLLWTSCYRQICTDTSEATKQRIHIME